jgi:Membrane protein involved in colicin uptake
MSWYTTGKVNLTNSSKTVTGLATKWTNPLIGVCAGQMLILKTAETIEIYEIASIQSDTQLTLANKYNGVTKTGVSYEIPTAPKVSIEALALRISEMLNYYQQQMEGWQSILTGEGEVTLTAPDGRVVTIKSQYSIANELIEYVKASKKLAESSTKSAELANQSATSANSASSSAKNSESSAKISAETASKSAQAASQSAKNASDSAELAKISEINSKTSEANAAQSAIDAKNAAESIDTSNFIQKSGKENQSISGLLNVNELTENGQRVFSPNNKPSADDIGALAATKTVVNNVPIYMVGGSIDATSISVNGKSVITDVTEIQSKLTDLNNRAYVTESYQNGDSWYRVYSDGFIEQSSVIIVKTELIDSICGTLVNLIKPMRTRNYGVAFDRINWGSWANNDFACAGLYETSFLLASFSPYTCQSYIRWTVRGY